MEGSLNYGKTIGWLRDTLARAGTKAYKIFSVGGLEWVTYNHGGEARYFSITGQPYTPSQFCEYCVEKTQARAGIPQSHPGESGNEGSNDDIQIWSYFK